MNSQVKGVNLDTTKLRHSNIMPTKTPPSIISAIEHCLKPLARLCIHFGLDYRLLSEMLKASFVSVAEEEFKVRGKSQTDSRITLLTGVHRKDVRRLLGRAPEKTPPSRQQDLIANLIAHWLGSPELLDINGEPKPIPRKQHPEYSISFTILAEALTQDIQPRTLLDECISRGIVRLTDDDMVHLISETLLPIDDINDKAHFFAQNIHDHIAAAGHNLAGGQPAFLDRFVWHEGLTESDIAIIAEAAKKAAMAALMQVNNKTISLQQQHYGEENRPEFKIHFGTFFYSCRSPIPITKAEDTPS